MATKKLAEDMEDVKRSLNFVSEELSKVAKQQTGLLDLVAQVQQLKAGIKEKDKKIGELERRVDDLEQYTRMEDLVVSGLETTHRTCTRAAADIPIDSKHKASCHTMPQKQNNSPNIIIQFVSKKT